MSPGANRQFTTPQACPRPAVFLMGPTGIGKTEKAIALAKKINAEIICCDSMQVYKRMDIITAMPSPAQFKVVKHHLFGIKDPGEEFSVAEYRRLALEAFKKIRKKGKNVIFAGGTGLYAQALLDGVFKSPPKDEKLRKALEKEAGVSGSISLHKKLKKVDPEAALKIHPNDTRRIIRALEVFQLTGRPISELKKDNSYSGLYRKYPVRIICLYHKDRERLYKKINDRSERILESGAINEVKKLLRRKLSLTARQALGIKEIKGYLDGDYGMDALRELLKRNTRRYAKRQMTWFRKDKRVEWVEVEKWKNGDSPMHEKP